MPPLFFLQKIEKISKKVLTNVLNEYIIQT